jgi:hypothetical protein
MNCPYCGQSLAGVCGVVDCRGCGSPVSLNATRREIARACLTNGPREQQAEARRAELLKPMEPARRRPLFFPHLANVAEANEVEAIAL